MEKMSKKRWLWRGITVFSAAAAVWSWGNGQAVYAEAATEVTFSAESGTYADEFQLELDAGGDTVYYTTDGSNPVDSKSRIPYTGPITVTDRKGDANVLSAIDPSLFDSANVKWDGTNKKFVSKVTPPENDEVDKATVIRAVSQGSDGAYSEVETNTYFVGAMSEHIQGIEESCQAAGLDLAIMSIAVRQEDFFDPEKGIYVHGNIFDKALEEYLKTGFISDRNAVDVARSLDANYKQKGKEWEREAHIDYFESNGDTAECKLQQDCGIRMQGNYSRSDLQKGMRLYAREDYGKKNFKYDFFNGQAKNDDGEVIEKYKKLTLRNGGNCAFTTKYSDAYWQSLLKELDCETQESRACIVYLNGEYWGIYILQEEYDDNYFEETHGVNNDHVVLYKGDAEAEEIGYKLDEGELPEGETDVSYYFRDLLQFFETHKDLRDQKSYDEFAKLVDVESVRDYFAANIWMNNKWDWPGKNWSVWKTTETDETNPYSDGRWRFCFYDLDFGGVSGSGDAWTNTIKEDNYKPGGLLDMDTDNPVVLMYAYLMTNQGFREDFARCLNDLNENQFQADSAIAACDVYRDTYKPLYDQYFNRFGNVGSADAAINGYYASYACITGFIRERSNAIPNMLNWVERYYKEQETPSPSPSVSPSPTTKPGNVDTNNRPDNGEQKKKSPKKKKVIKLKVTAKKGKKVIKIVTVKKAKVTVHIKRKIIRKGKKKVRTITYSGTKNKKGVIKIKLLKKLKKSDKIKITVKKTGYKTKKKTVRAA